MVHGHCSENGVPPSRTLVDVSTPKSRRSSIRLGHYGPAARNGGKTIRATSVMVVRRSGDRGGLVRCAGTDDCHDGRNAWASATSQIQQHRRDDGILCIRSKEVGKG